MIEIHEHKVVEIVKEHKNLYGDELFAYWIVMDCPVMPCKIVVMKKELKVGEVLDPHFNNPNVVARFSPDQEGWEYALAFTINL